MMKHAMMALVALFISGSGFAQETPVKPCNANYEVNAGPDIDVCESGTVGLNGILGGDATRGVWRGGKGTFEPGRTAATVDYTPDSSEYGKSIILTYVGDNPNFPDCPKGRDDIEIRINLQPKVSAGENLRTCQSQSVQLEGKLVKGKAQRLQWTSSGLGKFDDPSKPDARYTPDAVDAGVGAVRLMLKAYPFGVCMPDSETIVLTVLASPVISMPESLKGEGGKPVTINAKVEGSGARIQWSSNGSGKFDNPKKAAATYIPSEADLAKGQVTLTLEASREKNCSVSKKLQINF